MSKALLAAIVLAVASPLAARGQLTDAERAARRTQAADQMRARDALFDEWDTVVRKEAARAEAGDCRDAHTTIDMNQCLGRELETTRANFEHLVDVVRKVVGPMANEWNNAFDQSEKAWTTYRTALCEAASKQYEGGTIASNWSVHCEIVAYRSHINELDKTFKPIVR